MEDRVYIAIDLKSFYASVECVDRGIDPLTANLVVADESSTEKTICLAVSPSLKSYGISGRARLFEVIQQVRAVNSVRQSKAPGHKLTSSSWDNNIVSTNPCVALDYIIAPPRMSHYMTVSAAIYEIYLKYVAPEDIHVYSIDEVFIDAADYLKLYKLTAREFTMKLIHEVLEATGITATAGIGTNLYLCKIAMDIEAKHIPADKDGVRIAELDEMSYRRKLWNHTPLTDFWRIGGGISKKLQQYGINTMGDIARCSIGKENEFYNENLLYKLFGINAELLIDHAWGYESCTMADIKAYRPESKSLSSGQVLPQPYDFEKGRLIVREMADLLSLDLVDKCLVTDQMVLTVGYDTANLEKSGRESYSGETESDRYGRKVPRQAHGSINLGKHTSSTKIIVDAVIELYDRIVNKELSVRRMYVVANHLINENAVVEEAEQLNFFTDYEEKERLEKEESEMLEKEKSRQHTIIAIQKKYGKNAILKGTSYEDGATTRERNGMVGGHKA
ncbi:MAG: DNA methylase [Clostridia bacterium]|nr:DNA methylase [Clostridia bacterium]